MYAYPLVASLKTLFKILAKRHQWKNRMSKTQQVTKGEKHSHTGGLDAARWTFYFLQLFADGDMQSAKFVISKD